MIDTIVLTIPRGCFNIFDGSKFSPPVTNEAKNQTFGRSGYQKYSLNPTRTDSKAGVYQPRVTYIRRLVPYGVNEVIKVEFSAPKMLFLNNFDEIEEKDFDELRKRLLNSLVPMGIYIRPDYISMAPVTNIHYCKNIPYLDYTSANMVIKSLSRIDVPKYLDFNHRHFMNGGQALYIHSNTHQFVIYDKIRDLSMPKGRSIEINDSPQQNLFDSKSPLEVVRLEVRLRHKNTIMSILNKVSLNQVQPTFKELFSKKIAQKILSYYWNLYFKDLRYNFAYTKGSEPEKAINLILNSSQNIKCNHALSLLGIMLFVSSSGIRPLKAAILRKFTPETWYRLNNSFIQLSSLTNTNGNIPFIKTIEEELTNFKPFKLSSINN